MNYFPVDIVGSIFQYLPLVDILTAFRSIKGIRHHRDSEELWRFLNKSEFNEYKAAKQYKDSFILATLDYLGLTAETKLVSTFVHNNDIDTLSIVLKPDVSRRRYAEMILTEIVKDDNMYLLSWYLKNYRCCVEYAAIACSREGRLRLLQFAIKYASTEDISTFIRRNIHVSVKAGYFVVTRYLFKLIPADSIDKESCLQDIFSSSMTPLSRDDAGIFDWAVDRMKARNMRVDYGSHLSFLCKNGFTSGVYHILKKRPLLTDVQIETYIRYAQRCNNEDIANMLKACKRL